MNTTKRYTIFAFLALTLLLAVTLAKILGQLALTLGPSVGISDPPLIGNQFTYSTLISVVVAFTAGAITYMRTDVQRFSHDVIEELMKVAWPTWQATRSATVVVLVTTLVVSALLGVFDFAWAELTGIIYAPKS